MTQFQPMFSDHLYISGAELAYYRHRAFALRQDAIDGSLRRLANNLIRTVRALSEAGQVRLAAAR
ncbi:MAG TPA: hypothetical protein VF194_13540 [Ferrovibrio sp.]|uniref:hypothetical protein n=1 Tax=Ferrovibrio sp. TaxID=1917215 RepID=UPI002ED67A4C